MFQLYIHSPNEWPDLQVNSRPLRKSAVHTFVGLNVIEMINRPEVQMEPEERRKCRFPSEFINVMTPYSVSNCFLKVRMEEELDSCNCTMAEFYGNLENHFLIYFKELTNQ